MIIAEEPLAARGDWEGDGWDGRWGILCEKAVGRETALRKLSF